MTEGKKPSYIWDIKYENYVDFFWMGQKPGMITLAFGQSMQAPPRILVRLWMDINSARSFYDVLGKWLEKYDETYEKPEGKNEGS